MKPNQTFSDLKQNVADNLSLTFELDGFSPLVGKIFALLLFAPEPLSLQEIADQIGVSKAAVSVQIRLMERSCLCQKLPTSNDRKDYYFISDDFCRNTMQSMNEKIHKFKQRVDTTLQALHALSHIAEGEEASYHIAKRRYAEVSELYQLYLSRIDGIEEEWMNIRKRVVKSEGMDKD